MTVSSTFFTGRFALTTLFMALALAGCGGGKPDAMVASARDYMAKNDPKAAIIQLKNALQEKPDLPEARFLLGQALLRSGDPVGSETELRKALALKHPAELVVPSLAKALLSQGQFKKLTDEFSATELTPGAAQADLKTSLAQAQLAQGKAELGQAALKSALAADPGYTPAQLIQARDKASQKDFDGALAMVDAILARTATNEEALKLKGDILWYGKRNADESLAAYRKALEAKPDFVPGHAAILTALLRDGRLEDATRQMEALKKVAPNRVQTVFFDTMLAYQKKDFKLARDRSQQLMKVASNNPMALQLAGAIELQSNSLVQAEAFLAKAMQLAPDGVLTRRLLTSVYMQSAQPAKALATMQPLLKNDTSLDAATNAILGEVFLQNGDARKAEEYFAKAAKQDPKNERTRTSLALTHMAGGRDEAGLAELQDISVTETGTTATLALISAQLRRKEFDKALKTIDVLEQKQPGKPFAANLRGRTLLAKQDMAGARKSFERSLELDPTFFPSVASLAALDMADKKPDDARKRFEAVLTKDPKNPQALLAIAEMRARSGGAKEEVAELIGRAVTANPTDKAPRLLLIDFHLRNKDAKQALTAAQNGVAAIPDSAELQDALGRAFLVSGDTNQALAAFNKVAAMQPLSPMPQMRLAEAQLMAKDKQAAAQSLRKALAIKPDLVDAQRGLIALAMDGKNFDDAVRIARGIQKQSPKEASGYLFEGEVAAAQKKWDAAADAYRTGLKVVPVPGLAVKLHAALVAGGKAADADKLVASWTKDHPKDPAFRMYLGDSSIAANNFVAAEKNYLAVLQLQPANPVVLNNLAWVSGKLNREGAIGYAEKAIALAPNQPAFMDTLATLYSDRNDYAKALEWQTKVIALSPVNSVFRLNLAKIHIKGGKKDLARKELDELAKLGDKFGGQAEVASLLKSL
jgi:putative PEP-CTERM system TPR-repeat lipoprotein